MNTSENVQSVVKINDFNYIFQTIYGPASLGVSKLKTGETNIYLNIRENGAKVTEASEEKIQKLIDEVLTEMNDRCSGKSN